MRYFSDVWLRRGRRGAASCVVAVALVSVLTGCRVGPEWPDRALAARLDEILTRLDATGATVAARIVELPSGRELYAREADRPYTPASNMKIPISATGLDMFGAERTFATYLAVDGDDLWVIGTGDPGLGDPRLERRRGRATTSVLEDWAGALAARGVSHIAGDLYYYDGALDDEWLHPTWGESVLHWYGAPVAGLNFNDNCVDITVFPTEVGAPVRYEVVPPAAGITVVNECVTGSEQAPEIVKLPEGNIYKLSGTCAEPAELKSKPVDGPGAFFCDALRTHLAAKGITIAGRVRRAREPLGGELPPPAAQVVAVHETNVRDIIGRIDTNSQNFFAEALCKLTGQALAANEGRQVPGSWADGRRAVHAFLRRCGIDDRALVVADGSGLSEDNRLSARLLTDLYAVMRSRPDGEVFLESLAKGGVNGSLEERFAGAEGHVFAKTGYIDGVRALSGYVRTMEDAWLAFAIIYNNIPDDVEPYEALQDEAVRLLIAWPLGSETPATLPAAVEDRQPTK